jgi:hypothetical protein
VACFENTLKFTPSGAIVAPSGAGVPMFSVLLRVFDDSALGIIAPWSPSSTELAAQPAAPNFSSVEQHRPRSTACSTEL